jgi:hypothetical protein
MKLLYIKSVKYPIQLPKKKKKKEEEEEEEVVYRF